MELSELKEKFLSLLNLNQISKAPSELKAVLFDNERRNKLFDEWLEFCPDLSKDSMQVIYQYHLADRTKGKSQDFTPSSLAKLVSKLTQSENESKVVDMCAGSGALTIQKWNDNKSLEFICLEFDETVIPFLLFNLAIRNINGYVFHCDVLSSDVFAVYKLAKGKKYSNIEQIENRSLDTIRVECKPDSCISNPPYNVKWEAPALAQLQNRFAGFSIPPNSNANYVFVLSALNYADKSALILPNCVLSTKSRENEIVQELAELNLIDAVITCPDKMFEATSIGVCVLMLNKNKKDTKIEFIDMRQHYTQEQREQRGQFGGKSHTNRTYTKTVNTFDDEHINLILDCVNERKNIPETSIAVELSRINENKYNLVPSSYIEFVNEPNHHRSYEDIVTDLNRVIEKQNACKLVINETIARSLGFDVELYKRDNQEFGNSEFYEKLAGVKIKRSDYITFTKKKNEVRFENNSTDEISEVFMMIFSAWKQNVYQLNQEQNRLLAELRDALLPDLMSGKIDVSEVKI